MAQELKIEFIVNSALIISHSALDSASKASPTAKFLLLKCIFQQPARKQFSQCLAYFRKTKAKNEADTSANHCAGENVFKPESRTGKDNT